MTKRSKVPVSSYLVCATQRSGSTFLCEALSRTGVAGRPDEYFEGLTETQLPKPPLQWFDGMPNRATITGLSDAWGPPHTEAMVALSASRSYSEYLEWVFEQGTTPNGVFGAKMMWSYLPDFAEQVRTIPEVPRAGGGSAARERLSVAALRVGHPPGEDQAGGIDVARGPDGQLEGR